MVIVEYLTSQLQIKFLLKAIWTKLREKITFKLLIFKIVKIIYIIENIKCDFQSGMQLKINLGNDIIC